MIIFTNSFLVLTEDIFYGCLFCVTEQRQTFCEGVMESGGFFEKMAEVPEDGC